MKWCGFTVETLRNTGQIAQTPITGSAVRRGALQSMPSSSIDNCARLRDTVPLLAWGHTKRPRSSRLASRQSPSPSNHSTFTCRHAARERQTHGPTTAAVRAPSAPARSTHESRAACASRRPQSRSASRRQPDQERKPFSTARTTAGSTLPSSVTRTLPGNSIRIAPSLASFI